ncbi:MAG TPA: purine-nucleoside phosphorylase [Acidimicrobiales bacterium]|jgi:purine-nucleoside phosphorylase
MPRGEPRPPSSDPFEHSHLAARELARRTGSDHHDVVVVLGSGLSGAARLLGADGPTLDLSTLPGFPRFTGLGHRAAAWSLPIGPRRVLVTAGRAHLYEGVTEHQSAHALRTAIAGGCHTVVLTCAAGAIRPDLALGSIVAISDHLNLTGRSPLTGVHPGERAGTPFVDLVDAWSPRLRALAGAAAARPGAGGRPEGQAPLPEGVYAQLPGPHFETPAEIRMLRTLGADLVGMSAATEAIAARHLGAEVLGLAVVTNAAAGVGPGHVSSDQIVDVAAESAPTLAALVRALLESLGD